MSNITYKSCYYLFILLPIKGLQFSQVGISKLSWNTTALSQWNWRNFSCSTVSVITQALSELEPIIANSYGKRINTAINRSRKTCFERVTQGNATSGFLQLASINSVSNRQSDFTFLALMLNDWNKNIFAIINHEVQKSYADVQTSLTIKETSILNLLTYTFCFPLIKRSRLNYSDHCGTKIEKLTLH